MKFLVDSCIQLSDKTSHPLPMRECHPALHLGGCTANQAGSSHASQLANQSARQHLIQGVTDAWGEVPVNGWLGALMVVVRGVDVGERG